MEQFTITTRSKAHKLNNTTESLNKSVEKSKQLHTRKKLSNVRDKIDINAKQNIKKEVSNTKVSSNTTKKKKVHRRKLKYEELKSEDENIAHENKDINFNKSNKILEEVYDDSISKRKYSKRNIILSDNLKDSDKTSKIQQKNAVRNKNVLFAAVTPKSKIVKLSLTPHRSTKTPKKSPVPFSSPKTHSPSVSKISRTPRKLSFVYDENVDKSNYSFKKKSKKIKKDHSKDMSIFDKSSPTISSVIKSKHDKHDINFREIIHRFSKSPKIVLKSPKSKRSKSPKFKRLSSCKKNPLTSSPKISTLSTMSESNSLKVKKSIFKNKNLLTIKHRLLNSKLMSLMTNLQIRDVLSEPVVLLERLPHTNVQDRHVTLDKRQLDISVNIENNTEILKLNTNSFTELKLPNVELVNIYRNSNVKPMDGSVDKLSSNNKCITVQKKNITTESMISSTPSDEKLPSKDTNITFNMSSELLNDTMSNAKSGYKNHHNVSVTQFLATTDKNTTIGTESKSFSSDKSISDVRQTCLSNSAKCNTTYNVNEDVTVLEKEQEKKHNDTYEVKQSRIPSLLEMLKKHVVTNANLGVQENVKKSLKVRFTKPKSSKRDTYKSIDRLTRLRSKMLHDTNVRKISVTNSTQSASAKIPLRKKSISSNYTNQIALKNQLTPLSPNFNSINATLSPNKMKDIPKLTLKTPTEKKSEKKSSVKIPNFKRMHERMFARSESLVDAKKRLQNRHQELTTYKSDLNVNLKKNIKPLPTDTENGTHNRFGFKLRKAEATHIILKEQTIFSRQKQQHERRMVLKGVRTNRRFELQMKSRNINQVLK